MPYYALLEPTGEESYDLFLLYKACKYKSFFYGTFYFPRRRELRPVFRIPRVDIRDDIFERVPASEVEDAYRMLCVKCGRCCVMDSGAFAFKDEIFRIMNKLGIPMDFPSREVRVHRVGRVLIYDLAIKEGGRCYFYTPEGCLIERQAPWRLKPMICLIHHCSVFAERRGKLYIKVSVRREGRKFVPVYREVSQEEFDRVAEGVRRDVYRLYMRRLKGREPSPS